VPAPALRSVVRDACGYAEWTGQPLRRRELPWAGAVFIVNLGAPLIVAQPGEPAWLVPSGSGFVAGLHDAATVTETAGSQWGVQLRLTPAGAWRLFRQPMAALVNRSIALDDVAGRWSLHLTKRLQEATTWESRFAALDGALAERLKDAPEPSAEVAWAWRQLVQSNGRVAIRLLTEELGWSPKRLIARFREEIGLPPKQTARLLRFQRASEVLAVADATDWCAFAQDHGFYDQAHLIHEFRRFAGATPDGLLRRRLASGGFAAD
jgi:AraC-like DNA-binding protein